MTPTPSRSGTRDTPSADDDAAQNGDRPLIAVLDYGIGNLRSAQKSLEHHGADARLTADPAVVRDAAAVVLPGVGAFGACMDAVERTGVDELAHEAVEAAKPFLGICVGHAAALRGVGGDAGPQGSRHPAGGVPADHRRREAAPDAVERRRGRAAQPAVRGHRRADLDVLRAQLRRPDVRPRHRHVRLRRPGGRLGAPRQRARCPVPPREVVVGREDLRRQLRGHGPRRAS